MPIVLLIQPIFSILDLTESTEKEGSGGAN
jgi:hypothetical protein